MALVSVVGISIKKATVIINRTMDAPDIPISM